MIKIQDNFLEQKDFDNLQNLMMNADLTWHYIDGIDYENDKNKFQFYHYFYFNTAPASPFCEILNPILDIIEPISLWRIKANLLTRTPNIIENRFHTDSGYLLKEKTNKKERLLRC